MQLLPGREPERTPLLSVVRDGPLPEADEGRMNKEEEIYLFVKAIETHLDSFIQKCIRAGVPVDPHIRQLLGASRRILQRYYRIRKGTRRVEPLHSLKRYMDSKVRADGTIERPLHKRNWRKYKRLRDEKQTKLGALSR